MAFAMTDDGNGDLILAWLREIEEIGAPHHEEAFEARDPLTLTERPSTPPHEPTVLEICSPSSSSSTQSVFDRSHEQISNSAISSNSSVDVQQPKPSNDKALANTNSAPAEEEHDCNPTSTEVLSHQLQDIDILSTPADSAPRCKPTMVWITSCLQCVLRDLKCDKDETCCVWCRRRGDFDICLTQFVPFRDSSTTPQLLHFDDDDSRVAEEKTDLYELLIQKWQEKEDQKHWAPRGRGPMGVKTTMLSVDSQYILRSVPRAKHPGRGKGSAKTLEFWTTQPHLLLSAGATPPTS